MVGNMEEKNCWNKFIVSGKIEDYLKYRSTVEYVAHNKMDTADINMGDNIERNNYTYRDSTSIISS